MLGVLCYRWLAFLPKRARPYNRRKFFERLGSIFQTRELYDGTRASSMTSSKKLTV